MDTPNANITRGHVAACRPTPIKRMNIIKWVCYFSQGCATIVFASAILPLYYILLSIYRTIELISDYRTMPASIKES